MPYSCTMYTVARKDCSCGMVLAISRVSSAYSRSYVGYSEDHVGLGLSG